MRRHTIERTGEEVFEEREKLDALEVRWPDLRLTRWFIRWLTGEGPSLSSTLELLEEKTREARDRECSRIFDDEADRG